jgi:hypothetical protein
MLVNGGLVWLLALTSDSGALFDTECTLTVAGKKITGIVGSVNDLVVGTSQTLGRDTLILVRWFSWFVWPCSLTLHLIPFLLNLNFTLNCCPYVD